ncbi:MAG: fatty acid--CoA ligase [Acidobacteria bacterium]|nr:fatty acid--CoA ligase [Acidobacteriota bacterium]MBI3426553.1 fatty acid--CoA ligase [Acidobacteriota bacterium]
MIVPLNEYDFLKRALAVYGDCEAIVSGDLRLTYKQFGARVNRWANWMRSMGVQPGDRVAIISQNSHRLLDGFFGAPLIGAVYMPINFRLVASDFEYILNHAEAKLVIVEDGLTDAVDGIRPQLKSIERFIVCSDEAGQAREGWEDYETLLAAASADAPVPATVDENDTACILYTSGTTGRPKGVMLTHRNLYLNAMNSVIEFGLTHDDVYLHTLAQFHCNGWGLPYAVTGVGAKHVIVKKYEPASFFELVTKERMTFACMPPTMINMALNHPLTDEQRAVLPRAGVRVATAGSAPPRALIEGMQERLGWQVIQIYGLTETSPFLTVSKVKPHMRDWPAEEKYRVQTRTGYEMLGVEVRVVDDNGQDIPANGQAVGEIIARSNVVMAGYWRQPEATEAVIVDGWFHTGDMATIDNEGMVEIVDRKKDLIISGGENVSSIEVEGMLYKHPAVLEAACIGIPHEQWGETIAALIVLKPDVTATEAEIIAFCRANMAHFKCPRAVSFVDALPRTATGKIQKNQLREKYWQGRGKRVG